MIGNIPAGILVERIGRRQSMLLGLLMIGISTLSMGIAQNLFHLIGAQLIGGIGNALWMLSRHAYMADVIPLSKRGRSIALFGGVNRIGTFLGKFIAIFLGSNLRIPFYLFAAIAVLTLLICYFSIPETKHEIKTKSERKEPYLRQLLSVSIQHFSLLATAGVGQVCVQTLRRGCHIIIPLYATDIVGFLAELELQGNHNTELIIFHPKDRLSQEESVKSTWDLIDKNELMTWIQKQTAE